MVTQVPVVDLSTPHAKQRHQPIWFLSGSFTSSSFRWSTLEKEASVIMSTVERMHWLLAIPDGFDLFTDQHNLIFIFSPSTVSTGLFQLSMHKVLHWAARLSVYNYTCAHIAGVGNVWDHLFSRWSAPIVIRRLVRIPLLSSSFAKEIEWLTPIDLAAVQTYYAEKRLSNIIHDGEVWLIRLIPSGFPKSP